MADLRQMLDQYMLGMTGPSPSSYTGTLGGQGSTMGIATPRQTAEVTPIRQAVQNALMSPVQAAISRYDNVGKAQQMVSDYLAGGALPNMSQDEMQQLVQRSISNLDVPMVGMAMPINKTLPAKAKKAFGTTYNPESAGYIMHDGALLDFTGRHYGDPGPSISRNVDHRELAGSSRYLNWKDFDLAPNTGGGTEGMFDFMNQSGAVRWMPEASSVSATAVPTLQQAKQILNNFNQIKKNGGAETLLLGADHPTGMHQIDSIELNRPNVEAVINFYKKAFEGVKDTPLKNLDFSNINPNDINWSKVSDYMVKQGYDIRGAADAQSLIGKRLLNDTLSDVHKKALEYAYHK